MSKKKLVKKNGCPIEMLYKDFYDNFAITDFFLKLQPPVNISQVSQRLIGF